MRRRLLVVGAAALAALLGAAWLGLLQLGDAAPLPPIRSDQPPLLSSPALLERGAYLARAGNCAGCHTARGGAPLAGGRPIPTPFGTVFAGNLTPHPGTGLGDWSPEEFWNALHHGRGRDGRLLNPAFPYTSYTRISRADSDALYVWLKNQPPVDQANRPHELRWPFGSQVALTVWRALYFRAAEFRPDPSQDSAWNRGAYLVQGLGHCAACHAPRNALGGTPGGLADLSGGWLEGLGWYAPSLLDPAEAGVAAWPREQLLAWLRTGRSAQASALGPMAEVVRDSTQHLSTADLDAMARYLQSLPQQRQPRRSPPQPDGDSRRLGAQVYEQHCASCHGEQGQGVAGIYPALAGNRVVTMDSARNLLRIIQRGGFAPATAGNPRPFGMPPFAGVLSERELVAVANHLRSSWGHRAGDVRPADLSPTR